jgi:hypothetical protein
MKLKSLRTLFAVLALSLAFHGLAKEKTAAAPGQAVLWQDRGSIAALDLLDGPGGKEHQPTGKFRFVDEDKNGTSPKFNVVDDQGVRWRVKLGQEVKSETAATRLVWAAGYFADEDYYLPELRVDGLPIQLSRGKEFITPDGALRDVRLERKLKGQKKNGNWSWFSNPFVGTKEFNGLRVMMALINNWDLKEINNSIYSEKGEEPRYVVTDLGASFGNTGNSLTRSKGKFEDYEKTHFIQHAEPQTVDFYLSSRPFFVSVVNVPNYHTRTHMEAIAKKIPRADAKWLGQLLAQLSPQQIQDCFRAAGYSPEEVDGYSKIVQQRIADLNSL